MRVGKRERKLTENMKKVSWKQTDAFFCVKVDIDIFIDIFD